MKEDVTVALSGDGADEVFGGYRKHFADFKIRKMKGSKKALLTLTAAGLKSFRSNRSDRRGELNRKVQKLNKGLLLDHQSRYIKWCQFIEEDGREKLLLHNFESIAPSFNDFDWEDLMSMANSLEFRTLFLDTKVVDFANSLPASYKIDENGGKRILKDAFKEILQTSVLNRSKKGFEIPIKQWLNDEIDEILNGPLFTNDYLKNQDLFKPEYIKNL